MTEFNAGEVDGVGGKLTSYDGRELDFDLLVTIPLHGGAAYVERSPGLGDALGFVPTDKRTLQTPVEAERVRARRRDRPADLEGRLGHPLRGRGADREHRPLPRRRGARRRLRRPRQLLHRDRLPQGAADRLQLRDRAAARPLPDRVRAAAAARVAAQPPRQARVPVGLLARAAARPRDPRHRAGDADRRQEARSRSTPERRTR